MSYSASLHMYDLPEMRGANEAFWSALRHLLAGDGIDVASGLTNGPSVEADGIRADTIFTQTCGYPFLKHQRDKAVLLGTPCYALKGCEGPYHRSFLIVRAQDCARKLTDLRGSVFGCNSLQSNTGMNLPRLTIARIAEGRRFFSNVIVTGGHVASLEQLSLGSIDLCAIDCVTWGFLQRHRPSLIAGARILDETMPSPSLPFVTTISSSEATKVAVRQALAALLAAPKYAHIRSALALRGIAYLGVEDYEIISNYEQEAAALGYPELG